MPTDAAPESPRGMRVAFLAAIAGLLAILIPVFHHLFSATYVPIPSMDQAAMAVDVSIRRAKCSRTVEKRMSASAGGEVLEFGAGGVGQAEFSWSAGKVGPSSATATEGTYRVWARVLPLVERGEVKISLTHSSGEVHGAYLPTGSPREWQWLDLGPFQAEGSWTERVRLAGLGDVAWQLAGLKVVPNGGETAPPSPVPLKARRSYREFGDRFDRSPGHGLGGWQSQFGTWQIEFSLDPNRIPMQYSMHAKLGDGEKEGVMVVDGPEWLGTRTSVSVFPESGARCGIALLTPKGREEYVVAAGGGPDSVAPHQWSRLTVEAWGWTRRFLVDGQEVSARYDAEPLPHRPGLVLLSGEARFDDVQVDEIAWAAEDAASFRLPWQLSGEGADWRIRARGTGPALKGVLGELHPAKGMAPIQQAVLWHGNGGAKLVGDGFVANTFDGGALLWHPKGESNWSLAAPGTIDRLAVCTSARREDAFSIGPYRFEARTIPDPSDYLDFTPEEWEQIRTSPEADKLARKPKQTQVVGKSNEYAIWAMEAGRWRVRDGVLMAWARGQSARVRFWQHLEGEYTLRFRLRLQDGQSSARVLLGEDHGTGILVGFRTDKEPDPDCVLTLPVASDRWQKCEIRLGVSSVTAQVRPELRNQVAAKVTTWTVPVSKEIERGIGGGLLLEANGRGVAFDDVGITVPRRTDGQWFYTFDQRETDWYREGLGWIDHGGVSCALASNWVSLIAPEDRGMLWHKHEFSGDLLLSTNIEENTEWIGWEQDPSHVHHAYDNIVLCLGKGRSLDSGYRLEVNSEDRTATVLFREGKEVARVRQDHLFPIQHVGGHAPYRPRRNRISLVRQGAQLRVLVNGAEVLSYTDPQPLATDRVGIGGYRTRVNFSRIMVRELGAKR